MPINDPDGNQIEIINNSDFWLSYGGGIAYGYRVVTCKVGHGKHLPAIIIGRILTILQQSSKIGLKDGNDYDDSANLEGKLYDVENGLNQFGCLATVFL